MDADTRTAWADYRSTTLQFNIDYAKRAGVVIVAAAPIALAVADGVYQVIGIVYTVAWLVVIFSSMGAYLLIMLDATLVLFNRWPIFLTRAFAAYYTRNMTPERRAAQNIHRLAWISVWINPVSNLALSSLVVAIRIRPELMMRVVAKAEEISKVNQQRQEQRREIELTAEFTAPVIARVQPLQPV